MSLLRFQLPQMTTAQRTAITPNDKDVLLDTDLKKIFIGDGATVGGVIFNIQDEVIVVGVSDELSNLTTGTAKVTFRMPFAMTLNTGNAGVRANVNTAPTGSTIIVDINEGGSSILSTKLTIDVTEKTSLTADAAVVISDTSLADDAEITIDIDQIGSTIAGKGLKVYLIGRRT
jgi:hypothetical protein